MEGKVWRRPLTKVQKFEANEYVAACGDHGSIYLFECNTGDGELGDVFLENGTNLTKDPWYTTHYYHACDTKHRANSTDDFQKGYLILNGGNDETRYWVGGIFSGHYEDYEKIPVIIWQGDGSIHATTNLDQDSWETAKS